MDLKDTDRKKKEILIVYNSVLKHSVIMFYRIITDSFIYIYIHTHKNTKFMMVGRTTVWITSLVSGFCTGPVHYRSSNNINKMFERKFPMAFL